MFFQYLTGLICMNWNQESTLLHFPRSLFLTLQEISNNLIETLLKSGCYVTANHWFDTDLSRWNSLRMKCKVVQLNEFKVLWAERNTTLSHLGGSFTTVHLPTITNVLLTLEMDENHNDIHCGWQKVNLMTRNPTMRLDSSSPSLSATHYQMGP